MNQTMGINSSKRNKGMTLIEVVVASGLLLVSIMPILKAATTAQVTARVVEYKTRSLALAQAKLDQIKTQLLNDYDSSYSATGTVLQGSYLANVTDDEDATLKQISVAVGHDNNGNGTLTGSEILVTLTTLVALRSS